jgi:hypothetical protein
MDEKTQIQEFNRTQSMFPVEFDATQKRTCDYLRHGAMNLFATLNLKSKHTDVAE